jgi:hypothetical protein
VFTWCVGWRGGQYPPGRTVDFLLERAGARALPPAAVAPPPRSRLTPPPRPSPLLSVRSRFTPAAAAGALLGFSTNPAGRWLKSPTRALP